MHGSGRGWTYIPAKLSLGGTWKQIARVPAILENLSSMPNLFIKGNVNCSSAVFFCTDWWCSDGPLYNKFPLLFLLERCRTCLVSERIHQTGQLVQFLWDWKRAEFSAEEQIQFSDLASILSGISLNITEDSWSWVLGSQVGFSDRSVKDWIFDAINVFPVSAFDWCNWVPKKVGMVAWRAFHGRLPTADALARRNIPVDSQRSSFLPSDGKEWCSREESVLCGCAYDFLEHMESEN